MAYSRWSDTSRWCVFSHCDNYIFCAMAGHDGILQWMPYMEYEEFKELVRLEIKDVDAQNELFEILERNMDAIQEDLAHYRGENDKSLEDEE